MQIYILMSYALGYLPTLDHIHTNIAKKEPKKEKNVSRCS